MKQEITKWVWSITLGCMLYGMFIVLDGYMQEKHADMDSKNTVVEVERGPDIFDRILNWVDYKG